MDTSGHVDWLSITFPASLTQGYWLPARLHHIELTIKPGKHHNYKLILTNDYGITIMANGGARDGVHIVYAGEPLERVRACGLSDRDLLMHAMEFQGRLSRIDVAVDIQDGGIKAADVEREYSNHNVSTLARGAERHQKLFTDEDTLYIGSMHSERFLRAYNKGAQLHTGEDWLRLELECKKVAAQAIGKAISENQNTRAVINRAIKDFVDFPTLPEIQQALAEDNVEIPRPVRKVHSTYEWLLTIVAPALAKYQYNHPDDDIEAAFVRMWQHHYLELLEHGAKSK